MRAPPKQVLTSATRVTDIMNEIPSASTQQNAALVEQATAPAAALAVQAED
nr:hypothetical protein [Caballeronia ptereochthonis]